MARYQIISAYSENLSLDVTGASMSDGANVQVWTRNRTRAQVWDVEDTGEGYRILSSFLGKAADVASLEPAQADNVQMWTENPDRLQRWDIEPTGETMTVDGKSYPTQFISCHGTELLMECEGLDPTPGFNIVIAAADGDGLPDQKWALVPVPLVVSGDVYEIVPMHAQGTRLDVFYKDAANGTNIQICAANGGNNQKFYLTDEGDGYSIRDINSGKYVDVANGEWANTTNVQLYEDNDSRAQRWKVTSRGQAVVNGTTCEVVTLGAGNADDYVMDVQGAWTDSGTNVFIHEINEGQNQLFALLTTQAQDENMPVPTNVSLCSAIVRDGKKTVPDGTWYVSWRCSDAWATSGPNSYRYRLRTRYMPPVGTSWNAWGAWSEWRTAPVSMQGSAAWLADPIDGNLDVDEYKSMQVQFQVASQGVDETRNVWGMPADELLTVVYEPRVTVDSATLTADGLVLSYSSDYPYGAMSVHLSSLSFDGSDALKEKGMYRLNGQNGTFTVPFDALKALPAEGDVASIAFNVGSDQCSRFDTVHNAMSTVSVDEGTVDVAPTFAEGGTLTERATVPVPGARLYMQTDSGLFEIDGDGSFEVPYPFGSPYSIVTVYSGPDGKGVHVEQRPAKAGRRAHVLTWEGGGVVIWLREGEALKEVRRVSAQHEELSLLKREHTTVTFMGQTEVKGEIEGAVDIRGVSDPYGTTRYTLENAMRIGHFLYRSPFGRVAHVAVTDLNITVRRGWAEVSIDYVEESV